MMKQWRAEQMGSEGWAVFGPLRELPYGHILASNLAEEDAKLMVAAPALQQRVEALTRQIEGEYGDEKLTALFALQDRLADIMPEINLASGLGLAVYLIRERVEHFERFKEYLRVMGGIDVDFAWGETEIETDTQDKEQG